MTEVIDSFPWESISQMNKSNSWTKKKKKIPILCSCFILLSFIPLLPVIFPYSSLSTRPLYSIIYSSIVTLTHESHLWESSDGVRGQSYLSVLWSLPSAVLKNPTAFWSGCQGKRDRHPFGCYSKFQSELGALAFLGQYFPRAYLTRFLTFWDHEPLETLAELSV